MNFSTKLDALMTERGITNYKMEKDTGIRNANIGRWRRGDASPSIDTVFEICKYLNVAFDYFDDEQKKEKPTLKPEDGLSKQMQYVINMMEKMPPEDQNKLVEALKIMGKLPNLESD